MRIVASLSDYSIIQTEKTPAVGVTRGYSGKFAVPIPGGASVSLDSTSYLSPIDGGDVSSLANASLLTQYPMYSHVVFNSLLLPADIAALDTAAVFTTTGDVTRAMVGTSPNTVAVLAQNSKVAPARPGVLISDTIDITLMTLGAGADEFLVNWTLMDLSNTDDVSSDYGMTLGLNTPAERLLAETSPTPSGFTVYLSHDDGATYSAVTRLTPKDMGSMGTLIRIAFVNTGSTTRYLSNYSILF